MIGIIPAAGHATRLFGAPKFLLPTPDGVLIDTLAARMRPACDRLYTGTNFRLYRLLKDRAPADVFVYMANTNTMSETVLLARGYALDQPVAFGMPDTVIEDDTAFQRLALALEDGADVAVGVFKARPGQHRRGGMCAVDGAGRVVDVVDKPEVCAYPWIWGVLAWKPTFWPLIAAADPHVGYALPRAMAAGLDVHAVFMQGPYWDCGTPDEYFDCIAYLRMPRVYGPLSVAAAAEG